MTSHDTEQCHKALGELGLLFEGAPMQKQRRDLYLTILSEHSSADAIMICDVIHAWQATRSCMPFPVDLLALLPPVIASFHEA
jgi:hypothetical protein